MAARFNRIMNILLFPMRRVAVLCAVLLTMAASSAFAQSQRPPGMPDTSLVRQVKSRWAARGFTTRMVRANGIALHIAEAGKGDPVILLHGYPQSGEVWRFIAPELAKTKHVIVADLRGMGLSEATKDGFDLANVAEDIHQLVHSMGIAKVKVVGHDWGAAVGAVYALRYRDEVTKLAFLESVLPGAGFESMWDFSKPNDVFTFVPLLLMGESDSGSDTTADLIRGREGIFLHHLWESFTGDKQAAPFSAWQPYIAAMARPGLAVSSASYYRAVYRSADEVRTLVTHRLEIPVLPIAGEKGIGVRHEQFVRAFATNLKGILVLPGAGHFLPEERPAGIISAVASFFAD